MTREPASGQVLDVALELLGEGAGRAVFEVRGRSMRPTLANGDAVLVVLGRRDVAPGDLAVFRLGAAPVVHRCIVRRGGSFIFRGDGREDLDPPIAASDLLGRVVALRRSGEWLGLEGAAARMYGRAVATHARFWSSLSRLAGPGASRLDRGALRAADRLVFRACHRGVPAPPGVPGAGEGR